MVRINLCYTTFLLSICRKSIRHSDQLAHSWGHHRKRSLPSLHIRSWVNWSHETSPGELQTYTRMSY